MNRSRARGVVAATARSSCDPDSRRIRVAGSHVHDTVRATAVRTVHPVRRPEETACASERVVIRALRRSATRSVGQDVAVEALFEEPGTCAFTCQLGVLRRCTIVEVER